MSYFKIEHCIFDIGYFKIKFLIDVISSPERLWFYWVLIGWGIGLAIHGLNVFGTDKILGKDWEEKKIKEIMEKDKARKK